MNKPATRQDLTISNDAKELSPYLVVTAMFPIVGMFSKDETISHRDIVYSVGRDQALVTVIEEMVDPRW